MVANKKLNTGQINHLYAFTRQHFVEWYDLQTELVDHLANAIEAQWQQHPNRAFDEALQLEFKKFGIYGFQDVIIRKKQALQNVYNKLVWKFVKESFSFSVAIFLFSSLFLLIRVFALSEFGHYYFGGFIGLLLIILCGFYLKLEKIKKIRTKTKCKKYLLEDIIYRGGNYGIFASSVAPQIMFRFNAIDNLYLQLLVSLLITVMMLFFYFILYKMPIKIDDYLIETYPEYKLL